MSPSTDGLMVFLSRRQRELLFDPNRVLCRHDWHVRAQTKPRDEALAIYNEVRKLIVKKNRAPALIDGEVVICDEHR
jgi:predicted metalloprotease